MPVNTNYSCQHEEPSKEQLSIHSISFHTTIISTVLILILLIVFGNWLVISSIIKFKRMQNVQNILLLSLSICDLLIGVLILPPTLAYELLGYWPLGRIMCTMYLLMDIALCTASIWTLCMISVNRFLALKLGLRYRSHNTVRRGIVMIFIVWIFSIVVTLPTFIYASLTTHEIASPLQCNHSEEMWYIMYSVSLSFYVPLILTCGMYTRVLWDFNKKMKETRVKSALFYQEKKMHKLVGFTLLAFIVCWLPFFQTYAVQALCPRCCIPPLLIKFFEWLGYVNCALNPVIYSASRKEFRTSFGLLLKRNREISPEVNVVYKEQTVDI